ncbi:MAG: molybdopterin molybdenumtransferase MoeA [Dehalococcoidia bacterium]|nr:molybdopterin molybdenumtransferase MoeA [Dehalococcoidia bacterium]
MPEFFNVRPPRQAFDELLPYLAPVADIETVETADSLGRVIARDVSSSEDLPAFPRSSMDGYSVRASDTFGASESLPALFEVVGDIPTGASSDVRIGIGEATVAYTGGTLADGADAVVMIERTQPADEVSIEVLRPVAPGENVIQVAEDIRCGETLFRAGHRVRPQDIGGLLALGITSVPVYRRPVVGIVSTGDELTHPSVRPPKGKIRDINTYTIAARSAQCGAKHISAGIVRDEYEPQLKAARGTLSDADVLIFSAGSSLSTRDMTADVFNQLGEPGVLLHGISIKPGKPTVVGVAQGKPLFGLPGNPVSALVVFDLLVAPSIRVLSGETQAQLLHEVPAILIQDVPSESGREDYVPVTLSRLDGRRTATPVFGKSNLIFTLIRSDGIIEIPMDSGGLYAGETVDVRIYPS